MQKKFQISIVIMMNIILTYISERMMHSERLSFAVKVSTFVLTLIKNKFLEFIYGLYYISCKFEMFLILLLLVIQQLLKNN